MESSLSRIKEVYAKYLKLAPDNELSVDCLTSIYVATFHPRLVELLWFHFIGPSGSGKTELVRSGKDYEYAVFVDSLTQNSLASGTDTEEGDDPSLLPKLLGRVLVIKDLTAMFESDPKILDKILGDLRAAYDRFYAKASGKIGLRKADVYFGIATCCTEIIDKFVDKHRQLGERFLSFRLNRIPLTWDERELFGRRVWDSAEEKLVWQAIMAAEIQKELETLRRGCIEHPTTPETTDDQIKMIILLADLLSLLRTPPVENMVISPELPSRTIQQLGNLAKAHAIADNRGKLNEDDLNLVRRVVVDSLPSVRCKLLHGLYRRGPHRQATSAHQLSQSCGCHSDTLSPILMQYIHAKVIEVAPVKDEGADTELYRLTEDIYGVLDKSQIFEEKISGY